jgi:hypothetical protein
MPDRVTIWSSQLAANDFPPVCAMTGRPAEVWRKFKFSTPPTWVYALLILVCLGGIGVIVYAVVVTVISQKASGFLPLTREGRRTVNLAVWTPVSLIIAWAVLWLLAAIIGLPSTDATAQSIAGVMFWVGAVLLLLGLIGRLLVMPLVILGAKVMEPQPGQVDKLVELRRVHPAFVAAVLQMHTARMAQLQSSN